jgi:hypothetical protein
MGVKRPRRIADHSPPSSAEIKNDGAIPPLPILGQLHLFTICFNILNLCIMSTERMYAFDMVLTLNGDCFAKQHLPDDLCGARYELNCYILRI